MIDTKDKGSLEKETVLTKEPKTMVWKIYSSIVLNGCEQNHHYEHGNHYDIQQSLTVMELQEEERFLLFVFKSYSTSTFIVGYTIISLNYIYPEVPG